MRSCGSSLHSSATGDSAGERAEEAVGREVQGAIGGARRNPADQARSDDGLERIVRETVTGSGVVEVVGHGLCWAFAGEAGGIYTAESVGLLGAGVKWTTAVRASVNSCTSVGFALRLNRS